MADLLTEQQLHSFVRYWGGDPDWVKQNRPPRLHKRAATAALFIPLHHPADLYSLSTFWQWGVRYFLGWLYCRRIEVLKDSFSPEQHFRTQEVFDYFDLLYDLWLEEYGLKTFFQISHSTTMRVLIPEQLVDQVWSVTE